jgi:hypothetical protein
MNGKVLWCTRSFHNLGVILKALISSTKTLREENKCLDRLSNLPNTSRKLYRYTILLGVDSYTSLNTYCNSHGILLGLPSVSWGSGTGNKYFKILRLFYEKNKIMLMRSPCWLCLYILPINFRIPEPTLMKLGMYIIAYEPITMIYFINPSSRCVFE